MKSPVAATLVPFLLLWAPASVQSYPSGAPSDACATFTPQHKALPQVSGLPYTLFVSDLLLEGDQTCYVPDQMYTSEFVLLYTCVHVYVVGQCNGYSLHNRFVTIIIKNFSFCCSYTELVSLRCTTIPWVPIDG